MPKMIIFAWERGSPIVDKEYAHHLDILVQVDRSHLIPPIIVDNAFSFPILHFFWATPSSFFQRITTRSEYSPFSQPMTCTSLFC